MILLRGTSPRSLRMLVIVSSVDGLFQLNEVDDDELHPGVGVGLGVGAGAGVGVDVGLGVGVGLGGLVAGVGLGVGVGFGPSMDFIVRNAKYPWAIVVPMDTNAAPPLMMS